MVLKVRLGLQVHLMLVPDIDDSFIIANAPKYRSISILLF